MYTPPPELRVNGSYIVAPRLDEGATDELGSLELFRMMRVLRLIKLARLLRASRLIAHWQAKLNLDYASVALIKMFVGLVLTAHWSACLWSLQVSFTTKQLSETWMGDDGYCVPANGVPTDSDVAKYWVQGPSTLAPLSETEIYLCAPPNEMYAAAVYFAVMTITSIGYGDLSATAQNPIEQIFATILMLVGGLMWGFVIATFAGLLATISPAVTEFRNSMDDLNNFIRRSLLPDEHAQKLREYFMRTGHILTAASDRSLMLKLSGRLQSDLLLQVNRDWTAKVGFLVGLPASESTFVGKLIISLLPQIFSPHEVIEECRLFVIKKGLAVFGGSTLGANQVWGEDCLLEMEFLRARSRARCSDCFLEVMSVDRDGILECTVGRPAAYRHLRKFIARLAFRRMFILASRSDLVLNELATRHPFLSPLLDSIRNARPKEGYGLTYFSKDADLPAKPKCLASLKALVGGAAQAEEAAQAEGAPSGVGAPAPAPAPMLSLSPEAKLGGTPREASAREHLTAGFEPHVSPRAAFSEAISRQQHRVAGVPRRESPQACAAAPATALQRRLSQRARGGGSHGGSRAAVETLTTLVSSLRSEVHAQRESHAAALRQLTAELDRFRRELGSKPPPAVGSRAERLYGAPGVEGAPAAAGRGPLAKAFSLRDVARRVSASVGGGTLGFDSRRESRGAALPPIEPARAGGTPQGHGTPRRQPSYSELAQLQAIQASLVARGAGGGNDTDSAGGSLATPPGCHGDLSA